MLKRLDRSSLAPIFVLAVVVFLTLYPIAFLLYGSFRNAPPGAPGAFTLQPWIEAYTDPILPKVLSNSLLIATVTTILSTAVAIFLAWVVARTDTPFKGLLDTLIVVTFFVPSLLAVLGWIMLTSPRTGVINVFLMSAFHLNDPPFNIYSLLGLIFVTVLHSTSIKFIMIIGAFRAMDMALEEASRMSGAGKFETLFRVTLPLMLPAILGATMLGFIFSLESFEVAAVIGTPAKISVFMNVIYTYINYSTVPKHAQATALGTMLLAISAILIYFYWRALGAKQFFVVTGKGYRPQIMELGRWRFVTLGLTLGYVTLSMVLPIAQLVVASFQKAIGIYSLEMLTLNNYKTLLGNDKFWDAIKNTLILGFFGGALTTLFCAIIAYVIIRTDFGGRKALDFLSWLPWTVPGLVLAVGMLWAYIILPPPFAIYGTLWLLMVAYITKGMPLGVRTLSGTLVQISKDLEETSRASGASWLYTFVHIVLALAGPGFVAGWLLIFVLILRELSTVVLLSGPGTWVMATMIFRYWEQGSPEVVTATAVVLLVFTFAVLGVQRMVARRFGASL